jgi:hypothetical protein
VVPLEPGSSRTAAYCGRTIATTLKTYCGCKKISIAEGDSANVYYRFLQAGQSAISFFDLRVN